MLALTIGTLLAVAVLAYVLFPLVFGTAGPRARLGPAIEGGSARSEHEAVVALREIEFDRATGKLSDSDYGELKARYTERALMAMRASDAGPAVDDVAEAAILAYRARLKSCTRCGPRPEPDAVYCSSCGVYLAGNCATCGNEVSEPGAAFCSCCGRQLAA